MYSIELNENQVNWLKNHGIDPNTWHALQASVFPGAKPESILMAVAYCKARGLDVLKKPVHIVPMSVRDAKTGNSEWRDVIMPGISEYRTTAMRTGKYAGMDEPVYGDEIEFNGVKAPEFCKITVYRIVEGHRCPFTHTEYFTEAVNTKKNGDVNAMWTKRPIGQLSKCAEAGALRKAFPEELGGLITAEEAPEEFEINPMSTPTTAKEKARHSAEQAQQQAISLDESVINDLIGQLQIIAESEGIDGLEARWLDMSNEERAALSPHFKQLREVAEQEAAHG